MVDRALPDGGGRNVVNVILVDFRGCDTMGEITVLAVAAVGAVALARAGGRRPRVHRAAECPGQRGDDRVKRLVVVDVSVGVIFHTVLVGSIYLLFAGHNQPGGGFVGGLVAGAAIALRFVAGGIDEVRGLLPVRPWTILGAGVLVAAVTAAVPLAPRRGRARPAPRSTVDPPLLGHDQASRAPPPSTSACTSSSSASCSWSSRPSAANPTSSRRERGARGHGRRPVRHRHLPGAAAHAHPHHHRPRRAQPRRERPAHGQRSPRPPAAHRTGRQLDCSATRCPRRWP